MKVILLLTLIIISNYSRAGVIVGNGGDSLYCEFAPEDKRFPKSGFYVLDYALNFPANLAGIAEVESLNQSLDRIERLLKANSPQILDSFLQYRASLHEASTLFDIERVWKAKTNPLQDVKDEVARALPANCRFREDTKFRGLFHQTVVRERTQNKVIYIYDPDILNIYLREENPMQASTLFVHEWLWDFYENDIAGARKIRSANAFLHSNYADSANPQEFVIRVLHAQ